MENNILVIGNGFDLAHGLKTSYVDFIDYVKKTSYLSDDMLNEDESEKLSEIVNSNGFIEYFLKLNEDIPGWVDFEREIFKITEGFKSFFDNYKDMMNTHNRVSQKLAGEFLVDILSYFAIGKYTDLGFIIEPEFYSPKYGLSKERVLKKLKSHLDGLICALQLYLKRCQIEFFQKYDSDSCIINQISRIYPSYVITFNYTDTYKIYGIKPEDVFHVHGSLAKNNMVLGFNDDDPKNLDFVYFKKYFQRIQKLTGYIDERKFIYADKRGISHANQMIVHFYGHSMDKTDGDIIQKLRSMASGFVIYKYNQEDYEQKVINLIDVFGKDDATEMIQTGFIKFVPCKK